MMRTLLFEGIPRCDAVALPAPFSGNLIDFGIFCNIYFDICIKSVRNELINGRDGSKFATLCCGALGPADSVSAVSQANAEVGSTQSSAGERERATLSPYA